MCIFSEEILYLSPSKENLCSNIVGNSSFMYPVWNIGFVSTLNVLKCYTIKTYFSSCKPKFSVSCEKKKLLNTYVYTHTHTDMPRKLFSIGHILNISALEETENYSIESNFKEIFYYS
jgi:hypothetical protein